MKFDRSKKHSQVDIMLIHSASQLLTIQGPPQRGNDMGNLNIIPDGAVFIKDGMITAVGTTEELISRYSTYPKVDATGKVVMPGFVDPHTHVIWAGDRAAEFEMRLAGKSYLEILETGGGILSTVRATREASSEELKDETVMRLWDMFHNGTTSMEVKTGYGLDTDSELRLLDIIMEMDVEGPWDLVPTFLGAHAIPVEFDGKPDNYTEYLCETMLPALYQMWQDKYHEQSLPFVDVFCETGAFNLEQSRIILKTAKSMGFPLKIHADEFDNLGGTNMGVEVGVVSADHLVKCSREDINALGGSHSVAVSLPCTPFGLAEEHYTPAREILDAGGLLAIATDINPGTAWCGNMQFAIALACRYLQLTPAQAIVAGTINSAAAIQRDGFIGSIEVGKQADMLVLSVSDYRHLGYRFGTNLVEFVVKKGEIYSLKG
jgi:imidazolonepropionase